MPPTSLVLFAILSMQVGSATAKGLFETVGPAGAVFLRVGVAAVLCTAIWRPPAWGLPASGYAVAAAFRLVLAGMNLSFYLALDRIPLGVAVTLEFTGPLAVAILGSRRVLDLLWGLLAAGGIFLLSPFAALGDGPAIDPVGAGFALLACSFWALYILLGGLVGRSLGSGAGLALSTCVAAALPRRRRGGRDGSAAAGGVAGRARDRTALDGHPLLAGAGGAREHAGQDLRRALRGARRALYSRHRPRDRRRRRKLGVQGKEPPS